LAIIGIIAAITIPSIVANHQKRTLETQFAKAYRTLTQAINLAIAEHGDMETWDWKDGTWSNEEKDEFTKKYFAPYLNIAKYCPADKSVKGCFADVTYKYLNGGNAFNYSKNQRPQILLADGTNIQFYYQNNCTSGEIKCLDLHFDINGFRKPNTIGQDMFGLGFFNATNEVLPMGINGTYNEDTGKYNKFSQDEINEKCNQNSGNSSWACTAKIIIDGFKMNY